MKKNRTVFFLGAVFYLFALLKYGFASDKMSIAFIIFELLSFMVVLYLIYYILIFIERYESRGNPTDSNEECMRYRIELDKLKARPAQDEQGDKELDEEQTDSDALLQQLQQNFSEDFEQCAKNIFALVKQNFELMAGIAYCSNSENTFAPVVSMGLDDEWNIEAISRGDGLHGQAIADNKAIEIEDVPEDYFEANSGIGSAKPKYVYVLPLLNDDGKGIVIEIAVFKQLNIVSVWNQLAAKA